MSLKTIWLSKDLCSGRDSILFKQSIICYKKKRKLYRGSILTKHMSSKYPKNTKENSGINK